MADHRSPRPDAVLVPSRLAQAAAWSWRVLAVAAAIALVGFLLWTLRAVTIPVFLAVLMATQMLPLTNALRRRGVRKGAAAGVVLVSTTVLFVAIVVVIVGALVSELDELGDAISGGAKDAAEWLAARDGPLGLSADEVRSNVVDKVSAALDNASGTLLTGVLAGAALVIEVGAGLVLALAFLIYLLSDGDGIGRWLVDRFPAHVRPLADRVGRRGWVTLGSYVRGVATVATFDAVLIGLGLVILGVPLAGALAALVFLLAFIPIVGAWVSGIVAVLVALTESPLDALLVALIFIAVSEVESLVLNPIVYRHRVNLHPMATLAAVTAGAGLAGVIGAFIAVPLTALVWSMIGEYESARRGEPLPDDLAG